MGDESSIGYVPAGASEQNLGRLDETKLSGELKQLLGMYRRLYWENGEEYPTETQFRTARREAQKAELKALYAEFRGGKAKGKALAAAATCYVLAAFPLIAPPLAFLLPAGERYACKQDFGKAELLAERFGYGERPSEGKK